MVKLSKKIVSIITVAVVTSSIGFTSLPAYEAKAATTISVNESGTDSSNVLSAISSNTVQTYQATDYGLATNIRDGVILHAWCWSFNTIKANLKDIAEAGFTTVQTSPANKCNDSQPGMQIMGDNGKWWWHYQPTDWKIGNYQLGTRDDFKALCAEAANYGIKIIVDVLPNHTAPDKNQVSQSLIDAAGGWDKLYHGNGFNEIQNYNDRYQCTTGQMGGLWDVNTENPAFQAYYLNYCNDLIDCGASGFRYDTAKHIGLPSDPMDSKTQQYGWTNNFWPVAVGKQSANGVTLKNASSLFIYGEVLQDANDKATEYANYVGMCASNYGGTLRNAIKNKDFSTGTISSYQHAVSPSKLVTWVESHDTYCNAGESAGLTDWQIRMAWAIIAARKEGTPLFFSRPDGSNGSAGNRWGNNVIGAKGNDQFKDTEVAAVNKFRNAMIGESEYMRNINGSNQILSIERGTKGQVIINLGGDTQINETTNLANGTYTDQVSGGTFTVSGGKISGTLKGGKVTVLYNAKVITTPSVSSSAASGSFDGNSLSVTLSAKNVTNAQYSIDGGAKTSYTDGTSLTLGSSLANNASTTLTLSGTGTDGTPVTQSYTYTKKQATYEAGYLYAKASGWGSTMYAYVYDESSGTAKTIAQWPGVKMTLGSDGRYSYQLPAEYQTANTKVIFTDGTNQVPASKQPGAAYVVGKALSFDGTTISVKDPTQVVTPLVAGDISTDKTSPQNVNTAIKITTVAATGGTGNYTYKFDVNGTTVQDFSSVTSATWTPVVDGTYTITVTSKDAAGTTVTKTITYTINKIVSDLTLNNLTTSKASPQVVGTAIGLTATSTGGVGTKTYNFVVKNSSNVQVYASGYTTSASATWTPTVVGTYTIVAYVKDSITEVSKSTSYVINSAPILNLKFDVRQASPQNVGTTINLGATGTGNGTLTYRFVAIKDNGTTTFARDYATTNYTTWTPKEAGTYTLYCKVKDSTSTIVTKTMTYVITSAKKVAITSVNMNETSPQAIGTGINISIAATSSISSSISYKVSVYDPVNGWITIKNFSSTTTAMWAPKSVGLCFINAVVKDANGNVDTKLIPFEITE